MRKPEEREIRVAVVGLGYVGLPLAAALAEHFKVIGYDFNAEKIAAYRSGEDLTGEVGDAELCASGIDFTHEEMRLREANFLIVAVPTPIHADKTPDLTPLLSATECIGRNLRKGSVVVYESTVYPGTTEEICLPVLARVSNLRAGEDFFVGYSPERINPGDRLNRLRNIVKIVSGMDAQTLETVKYVYGKVAETIRETSSIRVAEAAKLAENVQRDVNIAFMNELSMVFHRMGIDTQQVADAMDTKWNALKFRPGLVGGHCIGVDPHYFIHKAETVSCYARLVSIARQINDGMSDFVARSVVGEIVRAKLDLAHTRLYLMGMSFKEDCADARNSRAAEIYRLIEGFALEPYAVDPILVPATFEREYGIALTQEEEIRDADCIVFLVAHTQFRSLSMERLRKMYRKSSHSPRLLIDVKGIFSRAEAEREGYRYWSL